MLSSKAKYGLKAMVYLAEREGQGPALIAEIAEAERIPKKFLDTILLEMKNHGLLSSKKGKGGGYILARPASRITVAEVIRILDGPLAPVPCVSRTAYRPCPDCPDESRCAVRGVMQDVRDAMSAILDNTSISDMSARRGRVEPVLLYDI
jgi:Rrf2 family protein